MASSNTTFHDNTGRKYSIADLATSTNSTTAVLNSASITKYNTAAADVPAITAKLMHVTNLCNHATQRLGPEAPFPKLWSNISASQVQRSNLFQSAIASWKTLEAQLDMSNGAKVNEWKSAFDVVAETFSIMTRKQNEALDREDVKPFIAEEEALLANHETRNV